MTIRDNHSPRVCVTIGSALALLQFLLPFVGLFECCFQRLIEGAQYLDPRPALVVGLHQGPGRYLGAGAVDHIADRSAVIVPLVAVTPVVFSNLETLEGDLFALLEAL